MRVMLRDGRGGPSALWMVLAAAGGVPVCGSGAGALDAGLVSAGRCTRGPYLPGPQDAGVDDAGNSTTPFCSAAYNGTPLRQCHDDEICTVLQPLQAEVRVCLEKCQSDELHPCPSGYGCMDGACVPIG